MWTRVLFSPELSVANCKEIRLFLLTTVRATSTPINEQGTLTIIIVQALIVNCVFFYILFIFFIRKKDWKMNRILAALCFVAVAGTSL